jgi:hypothetical protein
MGILSVDDMEINQFVTVHSSKITQDCIQSMGMAFQVKAINLPYIACQILGGPSCVLDSRFVNFMRISQDYVNAITGKTNEVIQT